MLQLKRKLAGLFLLLFAAMITACSSDKNPKLPEEPAGPPAAPAREEIGDITDARPSLKRETKPMARVVPVPELAPGFLVQLTTRDDERLNGKFRIDFDGMLKLPYDIKVETNGLSLEELRDAIAEAYTPFFRSAPAIRLLVDEKKYWVQVQGLVNKPGRYLVDGRASLDEIISHANGLQRNASQTPMARYVRIEQPPLQALVRLSDYYSRGEQPVQRWLGGESLFFQSGGVEDQTKTLIGSDPSYVQVLGQVRQPGEFRYRSDADFVYYLAEAGGPTDRAALDNVEVIRVSDSEADSLVFSMEEKEEIPQIRGGDIIMIHADVPGSFEKRMRGLGPVGTFLNTIATTVLIFVGV